VTSGNCPVIAPMATAKRSNPSQIQFNINGRFVARALGPGKELWGNFVPREKSARPIKVAHNPIPETS
jgi:hypothetical protein